ncbi:MAG: tetratricopeptide repeat protein [Bacillus sp. (in: Bacteria)]|nr:tetratricopeptide repeat protein [Bacillus sp. (in: firmicutes)]
MKRLHELSEDELLDLEEEWLEREDESNLDWIHEGVRLYEALSRKNKQEITHREMLAHYLLKQGEDMKLRQHSYEKALRVIERVVKLEPDNARAYYRLGFLYFYNERWGLAIDSFQQALQVWPRHKGQRLNSEQKIKAHHYILKCSQVVLNEGIMRANSLPVDELDVFPEIHLLIKEIEEGTSEREKPYIVTIYGKEKRFITEQEYEDLSSPFENPDCFILNQLHIQDTRVSFRKREVHITPNDVPLLELIMQYPGEKGISVDAIIQRKYSRSKNPENTLRRAIGRLRDRLEPVDPQRELIQTIERGYRWNCHVEYRMFKHTRDVSAELHLD